MLNLSVLINALLFNTYMILKGDNTFNLSLALLEKGYSY